MKPGSVSALRTWLSSQTSVLVCFSGGVDSSYLLAEAVRALGPERAHAFTAVSASLDPSERAHASQIAASLGAPHALVDTHELDDARYTTNPKNRCYFCKTEVYGAARRFATERGFAVVVDGFNLDDRGDHRPGRKAAKELGVRSPLDDHAFTKADIRAAAHALGLPVWDKPALACLSSRFPYGTEITAARLAQVAAAERALRALDFRVVRVRWFGEEASLEVGQDELPRARDLFDEIESALRATGFHTVHLDPNGYRQGRLNLLP